MAAEVLFPTPLHLTRQVHDPLAAKTSVIEEYGYGNRLVSVNGSRTAIADYEKGELTEIDHAAGTYSVTRFDVVAKAAQGGGGPVAGSSAKAVQSLRSSGIRATRSGRSAEFFSTEVSDGAFQQKIEVGLDRTSTISKAALEVLMGAAYPGTRRPEHDVVLNAAASPRRTIATQAVGGGAAAEQVALPVEQTMTYDMDGQRVEFRTTVMRVGNEPPPAEALSIPAGARLVDSRSASITRELDMIEQTTAATKKH